MRQKIARKTKCSKKIRSISSLIRGCIYRSNKYNYIQLVDDKTSKVIISMSDKKIIGKNKTERAAKLGETFAKLTKEKGYTKISFDRRGYKYHGRVKAIADGLRKQGINI